MIFAVGLIDPGDAVVRYGISVSTLQLAQAYAALANDGVMVPATLLKRDAPVKGERVFPAPRRWPCAECWRR